MVKSHMSGKIAHARLCAVITCTWESKGRAASSKDMEKQNVSPSKNNHLVKKQKLSLSLKCKHRFRAAPDNDLTKLSKPQIPKNTDVSTRSQTGIKIITLEIQKNLVWRKLFRQSTVPHCWTHGCVFLFQKQEIKMVSNIHRSYYSLLTGILRHMYMYILIIRQLYQTIQVNHQWCHHWFLLIITYILLIYQTMIERTMIVNSLLWFVIIRSCHLTFLFLYIYWSLIITL